MKKNTYLTTLFVLQITFLSFGNAFATDHDNYVCKILQDDQCGIALEICASVIENKSSKVAKIIDPVYSSTPLSPSFKKKLCSVFGYETLIKKSLAKKSASTVQDTKYCYSVAGAFFGTVSAIAELSCTMK